MARRWYAATSNRLIEDCTLQHSTKRIAFAMLARTRRRNGVIRVSLQELAADSGCSVSTVQRAIQELISHDYITREHNYRYSLTLGRPVLTKNTYRINCQGSYTLIPCSILKAAVSHSCFSVMLYLYRCAGRTGRAYPSIRTMANELNGCGASKASVCRALAALKELGFFIKLLCQKIRGDLSCNSYYLTDMVRKNGHPEPVVEATDSDAHIDSPVGGGLKLSNHPWINKITGVSILRSREKGVGQFGRFHKFMGTLRGFWDALRGRPPIVNTG